MSSYKKDGKSSIDGNETKSLKSLPNIAQIINELDERECAIVYALSEKLHGNTWEQVAKKLGLSRRQLFNIRCDQRIQDACVRIARELLKADLPSVYRALVEKAILGDIPAIRLLFEVIGEFEMKTKVDTHQDDALDLLAKMRQAKVLRLKNGKKEKRGMNKKTKNINVNKIPDVISQ